ncbi:MULTISPECIES: pyridoxamine 5'-phosphate oxidase family protein [unclassified Streptomyces]|uniref:helix-turn-helix domain-containing protein n=1 Tax=unclassified Streptomyces TaxID=2593676 RepID=UPI00211D3C0E|nr:pyridoxamine 5'-phosphate oxidase family protein [Streptomyces sp. Ru87]
MSGETAPRGAQEPGAIGRRVARHRERLGLGRDELAARAGMAPGYLRYLEEQPADPGGPGLLRLAAALETSVDELLGRAARPRPFSGADPARPELDALTPGDCLARLAAHSVGRVAVPTPEGPAIVPVPYRLDGDTILFRAAEDAVAAGAPGHEVAFEVDHVDEASGRGWSVLVVGPARAVPGAAEGRGSPGRRDAAAGTRPADAGAAERGDEDGVRVRITPDHITGRHIHPG